MNRFEIVIKNETGKTGAEKASGKSVVSSSNAGNIHNTASYNSNAGKIAAVAGVVGGVLGAKRIIDEVVVHTNSLIEITTGSKEAQQRASFKYNTASSYIGSSLGGLTTGAGLGLSVGGPVGAVAGAAVGAVVGATTTAINRVITFAKAENTIDKQHQLEDIQRQLVTQRETVSGSRFMNATQM